MCEGAAHHTPTRRPDVAEADRQERLHEYVNLIRRGAWAARHRYAALVLEGEAITMKIDTAAQVQVRAAHIP